MPFKFPLSLEGVQWSQVSYRTVTRRCDITRPTHFTSPIIWLGSSLRLCTGGNICQRCVDGWVTWMKNSLVYPHIDISKRIGWIFFSKNWSNNEIIVHHDPSTPSISVWFSTDIVLRVPLRCQFYTGLAFRQDWVYMKKQNKTKQKTVTILFCLQAQ